MPQSRRKGRTGHGRARHGGQFVSVAYHPSRAASGVRVVQSLGKLQQVALGSGRRRLEESIHLRGEGSKFRGHQATLRFGTKTIGGSAAAFQEWARRPLRIRSRLWPVPGMHGRPQTRNSPSLLSLAANRAAIIHHLSLVRIFAIPQKLLWTVDGCESTPRLHDFFELNLRLLSRTGVQPESTTVIAYAFPLLGELMGVYLGQGRDSIR